MATRFGWGRSGGDSLGDVKDAIAGRAFGTAPAVVYAISPLKAVVDASLGSEFVMKMAATSVVKIGNPTNYDDGTELRFHIAGITSFGSLVWDTLYSLTGALATFSTGKTKSIAFVYVPSLAKFTEIWRTTSK
jgi:hypothetical protein